MNDRLIIFKDEKGSSTVKLPNVPDIKKNDHAYLLKGSKDFKYQWWQMVLTCYWKGSILVRFGVVLSDSIAQAVERHCLNLAQA